MKLPFHVYDVVRVIRLVAKARAFEGNEGRHRSPQVGDVGTVVIEYGDGREPDPVGVESVDEDGFTVWCADFARDELELVERWSSEAPIKSPVPTRGNGT